MYVLDSDKELEEYLERRYTERIAQITDEASKARQRIIAQLEDDGERLARSVVEEAKRRSTEERTAGVSKARSRIRREEDALLSEAADHVIADLKRRLAGDKEALTERMLEALRDDAKRQGIGLDKAVIRVPKDVKVSGANSELDGLRVQAETDTVVLEHDVDRLLEPLREEALRTIKEERA